jgi:hypothetical protein
VPGTLAADTHRVAACLPRWRSRERRVDSRPDSAAVVYPKDAAQILTIAGLQVPARQRLSRSAYLVANIRRIRLGRAVGPPWERGRRWWISQAPRMGRSARRLTPARSPGDQPAAASSPPHQRRHQR